MKKYVVALALIFGLTGLSYAEENTATATEAEVPATTEDTSPVPAPVEEASIEEPAPAAADETGTVAENLEFISGEVSASDEAGGTITIKLYGETENTPGDKSITVKVDPTTDITDGEKDRDIKSLTNGTEVDVEYDPASSKATYIFVY